MKVNVIHNKSKIFHLQMMIFIHKGPNNTNYTKKLQIMQVFVNNKYILTSRMAPEYKDDSHYKQYKFTIIINNQLRKN